MFKFEIEKLKVINVHAVSITTALGGSITFVDKEATEREGERVTRRLEIPFAVARAFIKTNKHSRFLVPIEVAVTYYDNMVVCIEKKLPNGIVDDDGNWMSTSDYVLRRIIPKLTSEGDWYTDGVNIYSVPDDWKQSEDREPLTSNGRFYAVTVKGVRFQDMSVIKLMENPATRSCVAFKSNNGVVLSPAIWKNVMDIRGHRVQKQTEEQNKQRRFDALNQFMFVNLEFVLSAGKKLGELFGYEHIAFLELDRHMINLNTVNLPKVPKAIRSTYDTQLQFITCLAWLFGYMTRSETLEQYCAIRGLIKTLCNKGLFDRKSTEALFDQAPPQEITSEQALVDIRNRWGDLAISTYFMNKGDLKKVDAGSVESITRVLAGEVD